MRNWLRVFIVFPLVFLASCKSGTSTIVPDVTPTSTKEEPELSSTPLPTFDTGGTDSPIELDKIAWDDRSIFTGNLIPNEQSILEELEGKSIYHIKFSISEDIVSLSGHQEILYTNLEEESLDEVFFRLYPNIFSGKAQISSVTVDGVEVKPDLQLSDSAARLQLPNSLKPGEKIVIAMDFRVEVPPTGSGNYGLFGYIDDVLVLHKFYPVIPVYDDEGWNVEIPPEHGDVSYFDASFYIVQVTAPETLILTSSGVEVERILDKAMQTVTFAAGPSRGFYLAASSHFDVVYEMIGDTLVNSYFLPGSKEGAQNALDIAVDSLESFNERFGVYPYTELDLVSTPMQALGMEYPGITAISTDLYDPEGSLYDLPTIVLLESAIAHEVAHMWFYNIVGNDQVDEPWVDEAIVQYATGLYYLDVYGPEGYEGFKDSWMDRWSRVEFEDIPIGLPAEDYDGKEYGAIVYGRGPLFIDALADEMGQNVFDTFLQDYFETNKWGIGTALGFQELAERHCECDLTALFEEWVY